MTSTTKGDIPVRDLRKLGPRQFPENMTKAPQIGPTPRPVTPPEPTNSLPCKRTAPRDEGQVPPKLKRLKETHMTRYLKRRKRGQGSQHRGGKSTRGLATSQGENKLVWMSFFCSHPTIQRVRSQ